MHTAHALLQDSPIAVFASNPCLFIHFRTLCMQRRFATPFLSTTCALFPIQWGGGEYVVTRSLATCLPELQRVWSHSSGAILSIAPSQNPAFFQNTSNPFLCHTSGKSPVTPIIATLPKIPSCKSCVCHTCDPLPLVHFIPFSSSYSRHESLLTSEAPRSWLQICRFVFKQLQDAPPATLLFSCFCMVARGW